MSTTATADDVYVTCDDYCGARIRNPETDHDKNCGAPLKYRKKLASDLKAKRLKVAAESGASEPAQAKGGRRTERTGEVDGQASRIVHDPPASGNDGDEKRDYSRFWSDPEIVPAEVLNLQRLIDSGEIVVGGVPASKACTGKQTRDIEGETVEIDCPHKVAFRTVRTNTCNLEHKHTETLEALCLVHTITHLGGERPLAGPGPLFGPDA